MDVGILDRYFIQINFLNDIPLRDIHVDQLGILELPAGKNCLYFLFFAVGHDFFNLRHEVIQVVVPLLVVLLDEQLVLLHSVLTGLATIHYVDLFSRGPWGLCLRGASSPPLVDFLLSLLLGLVWTHCQGLSRVIHNAKGRDSLQLVVVLVPVVRLLQI